MFVLYLPDDSVIRAMTPTGFAMCLRGRKIQMETASGFVTEPPAVPSFAPAIRGGKSELT